MNEVGMFWVLEPFRKYADFSGRARRTEFFSFALLFLVVQFVAGRIDARSGVIATVAFRMGIVELIVSLLLLLPLVAVGVRRLHDSGRSGWWLLLFYIPYLGWLVSAQNNSGELVSLGALAVGAIATVVLFALPGVPMENRYGPDPRGVGTF
jgi:uncharacterized membrane protein YhaH (DUF805 family)